jgi:hypothetical protein
MASPPRIKFCSPKAQTTTPTAMRTMSRRMLHLNLSVPIKHPEKYTKPGIKDFVIWMKDTDRYRYEELLNHKLAA